MCGPHGDDIAPLPSSAFGGCGCGPTGGRNNSCVYRVGSSCWLFLSLSLSLFPFPPTFFLFLPSVSDPFDCSCRRIQISEELGAGGARQDVDGGHFRVLGRWKKRRSENTAALFRQYSREKGITRVACARGVQKVDDPPLH